MFPKVSARVLGLTAALFLAAAPALPCSICRCGDATFNALGPNVFSEGKFRLALDWDRFDKDSAIAAGEAGQRAFRRRFDTAPAAGLDSEVENRFTAGFSYVFGERVVGVVRVPWSQKRLTSTDFDSGISETGQTSDLSDPEIYALVRLWSAPFKPGLGRRAWVSLVGGVKTPWGKNNLSEDGVRLDEHLQSGTGSTDVFGGVSMVAFIDVSSSFFASAQYRSTGTNDFGYQYGNITLLNAAYERKLGSAVDALLELNYRHAQQDRENDAGDVDPNTGGDILYVTPRVVIDLGRGLAARASVQIPLIKALYGDQTERFVANLGMTYLF
jgi:hypothetical protein